MAKRHGQKNTPADLRHLRWLVWGVLLPCLGKDFLIFYFFADILKMLKVEEPETHNKNTPVAAEVFFCILLKDTQAIFYLSLRSFSFLISHSVIKLDSTLTINGKRTRLRNPYHIKLTS